MKSSGQAEIHEHVRAGEREFRRDTRLGPFAELVASAERKAEIIGAAHVVRPEVDQVAAFEGDRSIIAGRRVMEPVQLNEGIDLVRVKKGHNPSESC